MRRSTCIPFGRAGTAEIRVRHGRASLAKEHADRRAVERALDIEMPADFLQQLLAVALTRHRLHAEHLLAVSNAARVRLPIPSGRTTAGW